MSNSGSKTVEFARAFFFPWVKGRITVDNRTVTTRSVNTIGGIIPVGSNDQTMPLNGIASVNVGTKLNVKSVLIGLVVGIIGAMTITSSFFLGLILLAAGVAFVLNGIITYIVFNQNGKYFTLYAAFYCKKALAEIKPVIDQALTYSQAQTDLSAYCDKK